MFQLVCTGVQVQAYDRRAIPQSPQGWQMNDSPLPWHKDGLTCFWHKANTIPKGHLQLDKFSPRTLSTLFTPLVACLVPHPCKEQTEDLIL